MKKELTRQELQTLVTSLQSAFDGVDVTEVTPEDGGEPPQWDENLRVDYELRNGRVRCLLSRCVMADGGAYRLQMSAPLSGSSLPEDRLTERERELCRDDMNHDFISGVFTRRYLETVFCPRIPEWNAEGRPVAVALVSLDRQAELAHQHGQPVMDQLVCCVANQWKKHYYGPTERVVCRLTGSMFVVGCVDMTGRQLEEEMRAIYAEMPCECIATTSTIRRIPYTLSVGCAGTDEVEDKSWKTLYVLCDERVRAAAAAGGNQVYRAEA